MDFKKLKQEVEIEFNQAKQTVVNAEKVIETGKMRMSELQGQWQLLEKMEKENGIAGSGKNPLEEKRPTIDPTAVNKAPETKTK